MDSIMRIPWKIEQHVGNQVIVSYVINGVDLKATLTIPGADDKITEEIVLIAIENQIRTEARKRRFVGLSGELILAANGGEVSDTGEQNPA
jgi:hypothetical protein